MRTLALLRQHKPPVGGKAVADALGHASVSFTLDTYSHVIPGLQAEAVAKFESYLTAV